MLWAGGFPDDMAPAAATALLHGLPVTLVVGADDEYIQPDKLAQLQQQLLRPWGGSRSCSHLPAGTS